MSYHDTSRFGDENGFGYAYSDWSDDPRCPMCEHEYLHEDVTQEQRDSPWLISPRCMCDADENERRIYIWNYYMGRFWGRLLW